MKLSEAINLGATTVKMKRGDMNYCALGAACNALGAPAHNDMSLSENRYLFLRKNWPWLDAKAFTRADREGAFDGYEAIWSRFDNDVVSDHKMTLEQIIDYVSSVEPSCGECNRFDCTCTPPTEAKEEVLTCSAH